MINQGSLDSVAAASFVGGLCRPLFSSYCFSRIPATVQALFTGVPSLSALPAEAVGGYERYDAVVLFFIDGFGWQYLERYAEQFPALGRYAREGITSKLTSLFPSTTAAHVTCINTGMTPGQSGVYEWFYYEPKVDRVIAPLLFSFAGDREPGTLRQTGIRPEEIYPTHTLYHDLAEQGVRSYAFQHHSIAHSPYSSVLFDGATVRPYVHLTEGLHKLTTALTKMDAPTYFYFYFGAIDGTAHRQGLHSPRFEQTVQLCWEAMETHFFQKCAQKNRRIATLVVADHGLVPINPSTTCYLNQQIPGFSELCKRNRQGRAIVPAGSCRDFFLHIQEDRLEEVKRMLEGELGETAQLFTTKELIEQGLFGEQISDLFQSRVGNLLLLPSKHHSIWWYDPGHFEQQFYAAHGGLTREEMETPFLFLAR